MIIRNSVNYTVACHGDGHGVPKKNAPPCLTGWDGQCTIFRTSPRRGGLSMSGPGPDSITTCP
eukprot:180349-Hanusia_phi.AAC.1